MFRAFQLLIIQLLCAATMIPSLDAKEAKIIIHNRVIAKVNDKALSVVDIIKKMDLMFYQEHPELLESTPMRYEFYKANWKEVLERIIDRELVLQAAEEQNMPLSSGDVREEIEDIFGPNIMGNLEQAGLSYEDAYTMIRSDILIRRMLTFAVNMKALKDITPEAIAKEYERVVKDKYQNEYVFRIISIKGENQDKVQERASSLVKALNEKKIAVADLSIPEEGDTEVLVNVTSPYTQGENEFARPVFNTIATLEEGSCSEPIAQARGSLHTYRVYYLEKRIHKQIPQLYELEATLRDQLAQVAIRKESDVYFTSLRKHYDVHTDAILADLPDSFVPFEIR